ncbi:hypothetical protein N4R57_01710 [Rhodobacteraceae bacterium D3-12]|nr:hypothetical protein N4R57_01710 [Rhodobacteraceae bacterium D3-12]
MTFLRILAGLLAFLALTACAPPAPSAQPDEVARLAAAIQALGPDVDPAEAHRAAFISLTYPAELARQYQITDPPLIHNTKVNMGLRPRGLCWHWAEDMERRLKSERFETLEIHRAIANYGHPVLIEHSTSIISARGDDMFSGIVVDPWRRGGPLTWNATQKDPKYTWVPQREVLLDKQRNRALQAAE